MYRIGPSYGSGTMDFLYVLVSLCNCLLVIWNAISLVVIYAGALAKININKKIKKFIIIISEKKWVY
jgi:hypothetical protein